MFFSGHSRFTDTSIGMWVFLSWLINALAGQAPERVCTPSPTDLNASTAALTLPTLGGIHSFVLAPRILPPPPLLA